MGRKIDKLREVVLRGFLCIGIPLVAAQIWVSVSEQEVESANAVRQATELNTAGGSDTTTKPDTTSVILERPDRFDDF